MGNKFLSLLSEKNGKLSSKRVAGLFASIIFIEVIQVIIFFSLKYQKDIGNQTLFLEILKYNFIIIATALVGIAAPTIVGMFKGIITTNDNTDNGTG